MDSLSKSHSPFFPGQPVPSEYFTGRHAEIEQIRRAIGQVAHGKPQMIYLSGEYGIGKSSLAKLMNWVGEKEYGLFGVHVFLGGTETVEDVAFKTLESVLRSNAYEPSRTEKVRNFLSKYVGNQEFFGIKLNIENIKADAPNLARGFLPFFGNLLEKLKETGVKGIFLIFDELNGITKNPQFTYFIKNLVDENATLTKPLPILLMLCGVLEKRAELIKNHPPIDRIFEMVSLKPLTFSETKTFFKNTFESVNITVEDDALGTMAFYSGGFPKAMHIIGEKVFWEDKDNFISKEDVSKGIDAATREIGKQFVDVQVLDTIRSKDYQSILNKLVWHKLFDKFYIKDIQENLSESEKKKLHNLLQKLKKLNVIKSGEKTGEYYFPSHLVQLYISRNPFQMNGEEG